MLSAAGARRCWELPTKIRISIKKSPNSRLGCHPTLLHQRSHPEPEAVQEGEVVLHDVGARVAGVGVIPLVGAEPAAHRETRACQDALEGLPKTEAGHDY